MTVEGVDMTATLTHKTTHDATTHDVSTSAHAARNAALLAAEARRSEATHDAEVEYSETVRKLRERFEADLDEAGRIRLVRVTPAQREYTRAVVRAEREA
jgi:hypothetical protein